VDHVNKVPVSLRLDPRMLKRIEEIRVRIRPIPSRGTLIRFALKEWIDAEESKIDILPRPESR